MLLNIDRARSLMLADGVDGLVSATVENNYYLSGTRFLGQELFPRDGQAYVVTAADRPESGTVVCSIGEADLVLGAYESIAGVVTFGAFFRDLVPGVDLDADEARIHAITVAHEVGRAPVDALVQALEEQGLSGGVVAVDERGPDRDLIAKLGERLPGAQFRPAAEFFRTIRAVKTATEVEHLLGALRATEAAFRVTVAAFDEGVTERDLKMLFDRTIVEYGARPGFCLLRFGRGLALGQVPAGDTRLAKGDFAFFDVGCDYEGYKSDIGRVVSFGEPSAELLALHAASKAGQQVAIELMKPGAVARDVFHAAVEAVREAGIPSYQRQHVGHGIGIEYYDRPVLTPESDTVLEAGMIFEVETPYYRLGVGGAFIEDTVVVADEGAKILTTLDRDLIVVGPGS